MHFLKISSYKKEGKTNCLVIKALRIIWWKVDTLHVIKFKEGFKNEKK